MLKPECFEEDPTPSLDQVEQLLFTPETKPYLPLVAWFTKATLKIDKDTLNEGEGYKAININFLQSKNIFPSLSPKPISKIWTFPYNEQK